MRHATGLSAHDLGGGGHGYGISYGFQSRQPTYPYPTPSNRVFHARAALQRSRSSSCIARSHQNEPSPRRDTMYRILYHGACPEEIDGFLSFTLSNNRVSDPSDSIQVSPSKRCKPSSRCKASSNRPRERRGTWSLRHSRCGRDVCSFPVVILIMCNDGVERRDGMKRDSERCTAVHRLVGGTGAISVCYNPPRIQSRCVWLIPLIHMVPEQHLLPRTSLLRTGVALHDTIALLWVRLGINRARNSRLVRVHVRADMREIGSPEDRRACDADTSRKTCESMPCGAPHSGYKTVTRHDMSDKAPRLCLSSPPFASQ
jgi:hypothetical protein